MGNVRLAVYMAPPAPQAPQPWISAFAHGNICFGPMDHDEALNTLRAWLQV
jgi:hypothetical protein